MNIRKLVLAMPLAVAWFFMPVMAANAQGQDQSHQAMHDGAAAGPAEPGQGAFAAMQEIVAILEADPTTDWSKVDLPALRQHLADKIGRAHV